MLDVVAWVILGFLAVVAVTATFGVSSRMLLALAHDGLPYLLILTWPILLIAITHGEWAIAGAAAVLAGYHVALMAPRVMADHVPRWVADAPRIDLTVANVYVDNTAPARMARQLVASSADVIVIAEWSDAFGAAFDAAGGDSAYPHRLCNDCDNPEYVVTVASRLPLAEDSEVVTIGPLIVTKVVVSCGSRPLAVLAVHPTAMVDPGGYEEWKEQLDRLIEYIPTLEGPFVLAGDLNSTRFRPEFQRLLRLGLVDAHDTLGRGLSTSFRLGTRGALAAAGTIVRLDHALLSDGVWPVVAHDLDSCGSDHVPFTVTLAVRPVTKHHSASALDSRADISS
jgi:endonuclease/exonuclease/phosphatase (EEP) superfamily protein YafD